MNKRRRIELTAVGGLITVDQAIEIIGRTGVWLARCMEIKGITIVGKHGRKGGQYWKGASLRVDDALTILEESDRCEADMIPGDPTIDEIYARAAEERRKRPRQEREEHFYAETPVVRLSDMGCWPHWR